MSLEISVGVLSVDGPEAAKFLHAIVASDVNSLAASKTQESLLLTPVGKVVATLWICRTEDERFLVVTQRNLIEKVEQSLKRLLIRTKAQLIDESDSFKAVISPMSELTDSTVLIDDSYLGVDSLALSLVSKTKEENFEESSVISEDLRISYGSVSCEHDLGENAIPQEANLDKFAVSFTKGCYLGQELVCRIDSREASTPFKYFALEFSDKDAVVQAGDEILVGGEAVGEITSAKSRVEEKKEEIIFGPFNAIAKISRKGTASILGNEQIGATAIRAQAKNFEAIRCEQVTGKFGV